MPRRRAFHGSRKAAAPHRPKDGYPSSRVADRKTGTMTADQATARAFVEELYATHHAEIHSYLSRMLRDHELAADLTQETFVKAFRAFDSLADPTRARAWLYQIAGRTALDELRRRRVIRFVPWNGESRATVESAEDEALQGRFTSELERALAVVPARQRMAVLLSEVEGLSGKELAEALGITHIAARALLARGRESLRQGLVVERARAAVEDSRRSAREGARSVVPPRRQRDDEGRRR